MFHVFQEEIPDHSVIRMKLMYHVYEELDEREDAVLSYLIYPIEDYSGTLADFETMNRVRKRIESWRDDGSIDIHSNTNGLYYDDSWDEVTGTWSTVRRRLNELDISEDRITVNYHISNMEYEIIIPSSESFPYTTVILVGLKDIGLLKILGFNDLSIVNDYLKKLQFGGDSGNINATISFIRMLPDQLSQDNEVDTDAMIDKVIDTLSNTPDILAEDMSRVLSIVQDKLEE